MSIQLILPKGKTQFCCQKWPQNARISLDQLLETSADLSLRQVVTTYVLKVLKRGQCVTVDDCNHKVARRASCVNLISHKLPNVTINCCLIEPMFGLEQLLWRRELDIGQREHLKENVDVDWVKTDQMIRNWDHLADAPSSDEGFVLEQHKTHITVHTPYKVELPGLFIQMEAVYTKSSEGEVVQLVSGVHEAINTWYTANPGGRCVLVQDGTCTAPGVSAMEKESRLKHVLKEVAAKLENCVVFLVHISNDNLASAYCVPPNPGVLAFLSRLHLIDLDNKGSMYWYQTPTHMKMAGRAGLKHIKAHKMFSHTSMASSSQATVCPTVPEMLQSLCVSQPLPHMEGLYRDLPHVPLCDTCIERTGPGMVCKKVVRSGRTVYLAYRDWDVLQRYQKLYIENASHVSSEEPSKITQMSRHSQVSQKKLRVSQKSSASLLGSSLGERDLPSWMMSRQERRTQWEKNREASQSQHNTSRSSLRSAVSSTVYVMSEEELLDTAKTLLHQAGETIPSDMEVQLYLTQHQSEGQISKEQEKYRDVDSPRQHVHSGRRKKEAESDGRKNSERSTRKKEAERAEKTVSPVKRSRLEGELMDSMADVEEILEHQDPPHTAITMVTQRSQFDPDLEELMITSGSEVESRQSTRQTPVTFRSSAQTCNITGQDDISHVTQRSKVTALKHEKLAEASDEQFDAFLSSLVGDTEVDDRTSVTSGVRKNTKVGRTGDDTNHGRKDEPDCIKDSFERESDLESKRGSSGGSLFTIPDSYVKESSQSKSVGSSKSSKEIRTSIMRESLVRTLSSEERVRLSNKTITSSGQTVPDSFVGSSGGEKPQSRRTSKSSDDLIPDSFVGQSASSSSKMAESGRKSSADTVPESYVANTPSLKSTSSTKSSVHTVPDSLVKDSSSYKSRTSEASSSRDFAVPESYVKASSSSSVGRPLNSVHSVDDRVRDSFVEDTPSTGDSTSMSHTTHGREVTKVTDSTGSGASGNVGKEKASTFHTDLSFLDDLI